ncbi:MULTISPECIES: HupE/UreJ family protein [Roseateles]|uniref:HupE/UreJ family protein n=1 Tax=Pelomonas caseinilytica TaxID=2906763 RepID=A0ABS8XKX5_9BURK|nr:MULTISPECIES: HupE/UreJ family protein [unclassified Roseateles]MCE4539241.1 HupE/UreJ family protein [Pelomonas sp. P7]HEV6964997.1 HupE/UreJ family protein [Roseateles sp.]
MKRLLIAWRAALMLALAVAALPSPAHEMSMAEMQLRETARGEFLWQWMATEKRPAAQDLTPVWPEGCTADANLLRCGEQGLAGTLHIRGVGERYSAALVKVQWRDGQSRVYTLTAGQPSVQLYGAADDPRGMGEIARAYTLLGVEHILTGIDHLLFVIGLLFLVGFQRRLLWTITAFTAAHSLTLACSALGLLVLRSPPVEASIALSIVLVAGEALHKRDTLARRWPAVVAFLFGLVHGLGFAGALKEIGLPENHLLVALLTFNVGVELGQLLTVAACWMLWRFASRWPAAQRLRTALLYAIGSVAAYWSWLRIAALLS